MKNLLKNSLVLAILLISSGAFAEDGNFSIKVKNENEKSIVFLISEPQNVNLSIYSLNDGVIYEQNINAVKPLTKVYNLEAFPDGNYIVKLVNSSKLIEYQVSILKGKTLISEEIVTEFFKPVLSKDNDTVTLDIKHTPSGPIEVKVFNEYNEELYAKVFTNNAKSLKKFNVGQTDAKELTFVVRYKDQEFIETVTIK